MEVDLDNETRRNSENSKNAKKTERRLKDVLQQQEEDQKNLQHSKDQIDRLNKKIKNTKVNQEEAVRSISSVLVLSFSRSFSFLLAFCTRLSSFIFRKRLRYLRLLSVFTVGFKTDLVFF